MRDLDKLTEKVVLDRYKCINNLALSDNDNIEQVVTNNFITGKQTTLSFDEHSILSKKLHSVPSFQPYFQMYLNVIKGLIVKNKLEVVDGEQIKKNLLLEVIKQEHLTSQLKVRSILMITMVYLGEPKRL